MPSLLWQALDRLIVPAPDKARTGWLSEWTYAHRGLHGAGRVENSASAFRAAVEAGLGIECDIQRSLDDVPMVFHDWDFTRLIGRPEKTGALSAAEWRELAYLESEEPPIALADLLAMVAGRVPLLIEVKSKPGYDVVRSCEEVAHALAGYKGLVAVMSFDPRVARWFRKNASEILAGLVMREDSYGFTPRAWQRHFALWTAKPDFIAYHVEALTSPMIAGLRRRGMPVLTWTVNTAAAAATARQYADAPIAEGEGLDKVAA